MNDHINVKKINVSSCVIGEEERNLLSSCVDTNWITMGARVDEFEKLFSEFCGTKHAVATCNGTAALHLALIGAGVRGGDEVIVPDLTYVASANAVMYCGAKLVLCDILSDTWCLDPNDVERKITEKTKAVMAVHLYGHPCDMNALRNIADKYSIVILEDAAEAHGAEVCGRKVGSFGISASFSFYGNKMITTGEGGMCTTDSDQVAEIMRLYRGQGVDLKRRYWHTVVGYNYRMTDLQGAIGCAQMKVLENSINHRRMLAELYNSKFKGSDLLLPVEKEWAKNVYWLYSIVVPDILCDGRDNIMRKLAEKGIDTRPIFYPVHQLPPYTSLGTDNDFPVACKIAQGGISLPTHSQVTLDDAEYITEQLTCILHEESRIKS